MLILITHCIVLGNSMKAHFKRSMKEYEAKFLKERHKEKEQKAEKGPEHLDARKNMPKLTYSQEDTRMSLASSLPSSSITHRTKDTKTLTKRSFPLHKRVNNMHGIN